MSAGQDADGFWRDYRLEPGSSQAWTSASVAWALSCPPVAIESLCAITSAAEAVRRIVQHNGWGYNLETAVDADTTAWVARWWARIDYARELPLAQWLRPYVDEQGNVRTFSNAERFGSWAHPHADVAPLVGSALVALGGASATVATIRQRILTNASQLWPAFWWESHEYSLACNLDFLKQSGGVPAGLRSRALACLRDLVPNSSFRCAYWLHASVLLGVSDELPVDPLLQKLLALQMPDGGWPSSQVLRVPAQWKSSDNSGCEAFADCQRLMSTAAVITALKRHIQHDSE